MSQFFYNTVHQQMRWMTSDEYVFLFLEFFFWWKFYFIALFFVHYNIIHLRYFWFNSFLKNCSLLDRLLGRAGLYRATSYHPPAECTFSDEIGSPKSSFITFTWWSINFLFWTPFLLFFRIFYFLSWFLCLLSFDQLNLLSHLPSCFCVSDFCNFSGAMNAGYHE